MLIKVNYENLEVIASAMSATSRNVQSVSGYVMLVLIVKRAVQCSELIQAIVYFDSQLLSCCAVDLSLKTNLTPTLDYGDRFGDLLVVVPL